MWTKPNDSNMAHEPRTRAMPHLLLSAFVILLNIKYTWLSVLSVFSSL